MSVSSKMTAIADKIRALLGISGTMSLDDMASNLTTVQSDITSAFSAVRGKGGTVPSSQVSGNLASAINSISSGVTVQTKTGTFKSGTSTSNTVTVNCGFKPDTVRLIIPEDGSDPYPYEVTIDFNTSQSGSNCFALWSNDDDYTSWSVIFEQTNTGFKVNAYAWDSSWKSAYLRKTFQYTAKKYTE